MKEVVFQVFQVFYTKPRKQRRRALKTMIKWCVKEYLNTFKKDDDYTLNVMTNEITKIND